MAHKPKTLEEIGIVATLRAPPIKEGVMHIHFVRITNNRFDWVLKERRIEGICGTERCIILTVNVESDCSHDWRPAEPLTFICRVCNEHRVFDVALS
jgi:hypothetical protein